MKKIILVIMGILFLTGCDYKDLNDLSIASAIGIDIKDDKYFVSVQIMDLKKDGQNTSESSLLYKASGTTISEAFLNINTTYNKTLYLGHVELIIFGKNIIEKNISDTFDHFLRDPELMLEFYALVAPEDDAYDILNQKDAGQSFPAKAIISTIDDTNKFKGSVTTTNFEEFISYNLETGITPLLSSIYLIKNEPINPEQELDIYNYLKLGELVVFEDGKKVHTLTDLESITYNILNNDTNTINIYSIYEDKTLTVTSNNLKTKLDLKIDKNNKINLEIKVSGEGEISETKEKDFLKDNNVLNKIQKNIEDKIKNDINNFLDTCKNNNIDPLGLENKIYKFYNKKYKKFKDKNIYELINTEIDVDISIFNSGNTYFGIS